MYVFLAKVKNVLYNIYLKLLIYITISNISITKYFCTILIRSLWRFIAPLKGHLKVKIDGDKVENNFSYVDDGDKLVVQWKDVQMTNKDGAVFANVSMQAILDKFGDITFIYKEVEGMAIKLWENLSLMTYGMCQMTYDI